MSIYEIDATQRRGSYSPLEAQDPIQQINTKSVSREGLQPFNDEQRLSGFSLRPINRLEEFLARVDRFKRFLAQKACPSLELVPTIIFMVAFALLLIFAIFVISVIIKISILSKGSGDFENNVRKPQQIYFFNLARPPKIPLMPANVTLCEGFGFICAHNPHIVIGTYQRCDGNLDCPDGSDEIGCKICHTTFNCSTQKKYVKCLRGMKLCDGVRDCVDNSDEELYCKSKCSENEMICEGTRKCLPLEFKCNGDFDCEGGDDEEFCENRCVGGSKWCAVSKKCIPSWQICNGIDECGDGSDEEQCDCQLCSGSNKALCAITKKCITREKICDRNEDCHYGEDELQCPGGCFEVLVKQHEEMIECADKKKYVKKYACSGMLDQCKHFCEECDKELAFRCGNGLCIPRNKVCDGNNDCNDHSDEMKCGCSDIKSLNETATFFFCNVSAKGVRKCISISQRCDGYLDCEDGADEINCNECTTNSNAIYCNLTRTCLASIKRCDGVQDCPNDIDEFECSCKECNIHANPMYYCSDSARCYRHNKICNPFSTCPYPQDSDRQYCAYKDRIL